MAKLLSQSLLYIAAAALAARGANVVIEDFSGPVDAFFLDDGTAAGLPSSGNSALEKVDDGFNSSARAMESGSTRISIPIERPRNPQTSSGGTATLLS